MFILAFVSMITYAQSLTVTGKVLDSEGYEVIGGSVVVKGAAGVGTVTDLDGKYTLKVNDASKDVLVFSYVGMTSQEVKVNNQSVINVTLQADAVLLEDVVVIGYAAVPRRDLTGSVTSVSSKELSKVPVSDVTQALAGRMAGVMVQQSEGTPVLPFLYVYVEVSLSLKATSPFTSLMASLVKTVCQPLTPLKLKPSTY